MPWATPEGVAEVMSLVAGLEPNSAGFVHVRCPFCGSKRRSLYYRTESGWFSCWRCNTQAWSRGKPDGPLDVVDERPPVGYVPLPDGFELLEQEPLPPRLEPYVRYLLGRGLEVDTILDVGVGACSSGELEGFVVVPVVVRGLPVGWVARSIVKKRYHFPQDFHRNAVVLNQDALDEETSAPVAVVEGPFDALRHWPHAVACFGQPTKHHVETLLGASRPLCVMLDGDKRREGRALAQELYLFGKDVTLAEVPPGTDPGKLPHDKFMDLLLSSTSSAIF